MRAMIWDFYLRLRRLTLSSELRKLSRAGSRSTFYNAAQSRGRRPRLQPFTDHRSRLHLNAELGEDAGLAGVLA